MVPVSQLVEHSPQGVQGPFLQWRGSLPHGFSSLRYGGPSHSSLGPDGQALPPCFGSTKTSRVRCILPPSFLQCLEQFPQGDQSPSTQSTGHGTDEQFFASTVSPQPFGSTMRIRVWIPGGEPQVLEHMLQADHLPIVQSGGCGA